MIYVDKDQLNQVEYLIGQSILGHHVLFDTDTLRRVFKTEALRPRATKRDPDVEESYAVEPLIEKLISQPTLAEKRAYLEHLDRDTFERVVRTYFNIVENNLFEQQEAKH